ncbi:hypothetical protein E6H23_07910 [Candidatus Bathyarchaeota archaeon]|nr:MAG: hypothetical protein E6H23_07910 [Candidatus Bathyarchaeota archaeon]
MEQEIRWGGRKVQLVRVRKASGGPELVFPFEKTGLHIAFHPGLNPHLREGNREGNRKGVILAEIDMDAIKG